MGRRNYKSRGNYVCYLNGRMTNGMWVGEETELLLVILAECVDVLLLYLVGEWVGCIQFDSRI